MAARNTMPVSQALLRAIHVTAEAIAPDALCFCTDNEEFMEMVLDADRVSTFGDDPEAAAELAALYDTYTPREVIANLLATGHFNYV